ncbi:MAG: hypothetical protein HYT80_08010 [Euryarchaeota archaeon]|nr:hypothetical protein [Euryarchaeota archaeon]
MLPMPRLLLVLPSALLLAGLAALPTAADGKSADGPPDDGDWIITGRERVENQTVNVRGDLIIRKGAVLELISSTLVMNRSRDLELLARIDGGGQLYLNGTPTAKSQLVGGGPKVDAGELSYLVDFNYHILVEKGGIIAGRECRVADARVNQNLRSPPLRDTPFGWGEGFFAVNGTLELVSCVLDGTGIESNGGSISLAKVTTKHTEQTLYANGGSVRISDSPLGAGVVLRGVSPVMIWNYSAPQLGMHTMATSSNVHSSTDVLENLRFAGGTGDCYVLSGPPGGTEVRLYRAQFTGCPQAILLIDASLAAEEFLIQGSKKLGSGGAIEVDGGRLVLQNGTIKDNRGHDLFTRGRSEIILRNVSWDRAKMLLASGADPTVHEEGLLPVGDAWVVAENSRLETALRARTDAQGVAYLWVPVAKYSGGKDGQWVENDKTWRVRLASQPADAAISVKVTSLATTAHVKAAASGAGIDAPDWALATTASLAAFLAMRRIGRPR